MAEDQEDFIPGEFYWLKIDSVWEVCKCFEFPPFEGGIAFEIMGVEHYAYNKAEFSEAIHIPRPEG